ncbi:MAG: Flp pilus assembly complex ATPase component TadA [Rickettsiales bacterium]|jgi:type IV secretory pathway ATPase VirB11/archaellum biosynthesis ATPase|nr:Flp pilus assembly complex ATPase component TadA [Rickettsiales bacterium]
MNAVLDTLLKTMEEFYLPEFVEEIAVNNEGRVWMRLHGAKIPWVPYNSDKLTKGYLLTLIRAVANVYDKPFGPERGVPVVYATLAGNHRFVAIAGQNVMYDDNDLTGGVAINIRGAGAKDASFEKYHLTRGAPLKKISKRKAAHPDDPHDRLISIIESGAPIIISGATATGKTTLLNHMLTLISPNLRVITIEDSREINVPQENRVHLMLSRTEQNNDFDYAKLLDLVVRMTPDVVIGGEISTSNASALWEILGTGHSHFYTTIHAESSDAAYEAFADRILHTQPAYNRTELIKEMKKKIHVVQVARDGSLRAITEVV